MRKLRNRLGLRGRRGEIFVDSFRLCMKVNKLLLNILIFCGNVKCIKLTFRQKDGHVYKEIKKKKTLV